ncbi:UNVERIFIED_CONTAM: hypothetical protein FKN15_078401 [Acipenser sinensis]
MEEEEIIRIAKKMDKMAQKKNGVRAFVSKDLLNVSCQVLKIIPSDKILSLKTVFGVSLLQSEALDLLKELKNIPMTLELLQSTRIGMSVNAIRKQSTDEESSSSSSSNSSSKDEAGDVPVNSLITTFPRAPNTSDSVRIKCREMLSNALQAGEFKNIDMKYKNRVRSRIANLKDIKNPNLRRNVLCGNVAPDRMAKMTAEKGGGASAHQVIVPEGKRCGNRGLEEKRLHSLIKGE